jgi:spore maturation protein CgeB
MKLFDEKPVPPHFEGRVLAVSPIGGYGGFNTSIHRVRSLEELGFSVTVIDSAFSERLKSFQMLSYRLRGKAFRLGLPLSLLDYEKINEQMVSKVKHRTYDYIWLDKALMISPKTLAAVKMQQPHCRIVGFSPDDMNQRHNQSIEFLQGLCHYDSFITTKSYNVPELVALGARNVIFLNNGYDPTQFRPIHVPCNERGRLGGDVGFIGAYEEARARSMYFLAKHGVSVRVWGPGWERCRIRHSNLRIECKPLYRDDFSKACNSFKINLAFLRKINRDLQTTRTVEIPGCGGFMLAERTIEHQRLFLEGEEADFFANDEELKDKCLFYLGNDRYREAIAAKGHERCIHSGYDNTSRLRKAFGIILQDNGESSVAE